MDYEDNLSEYSFHTANGGSEASEVSEASERSAFEKDFLKNPTKCSNDVINGLNEIHSKYGTTQKILYKLVNFDSLYTEYRKINFFTTVQGLLLEDFFYNKCIDWTMFMDMINVTTLKGTNNKGLDKGNKNGIYIGNNQFLKFKERSVIVKGHMQSKKTNYIINQAIFYLMCGLNSVIVLRNSTEDRVQLTNRIQDFKNEFELFAKEKHVNINNLKINVVSSEDEIKNNTNCIYIIIKEHTNFNFVSGILNDKKYVLIIDEVDNVYNKIENGDAICYSYIKELKMKSLFTIGVSATITGTYSKWNLQPDCIRELIVPENYVGIGQLTQIAKNTGSLNVNINTDDIEYIFETIPCLKDHLRMIATEEVTNKINIDLVCVTHNIKPNEKIFKWMCKTYPNVSSICMTEDGIKVFSSGKHKLYKNLGIGNILKKLEKSNKSSRNVIFSSRTKAGRGISFSSTCKNNGINRWHVNRMLLKLTEDMTYDNILQLAGRLCGIFSPGTQQTLYASKGDIESINKAYNLQEDLVSRTVRKYGKMEEVSRNISGEIKKVNEYSQCIDITVHDTGKQILENTETSSWKYESHKITKTGRDSTVTRVLNNFANPKKVGNDGHHIEEDFMFNIIYEERDEEDEKLGEFLSKWKTDDSNIAKFFRSLKNIYKNYFTKNEIIKMAEKSGAKNPGAFPGHIMTTKTEGGYGKFFEKNDKGHRLIPALRSNYEKLFV